MKTFATISLLMMSSLTQAQDLYREYADDRTLLRDTIEISLGTDSKESIKASSEGAVQAASRLFSRVPMLFKSREEILAILGDPATISDYGIKPKPEMDADLVYRFDSGFGGWQFTIKFRNDRVWAIQAEDLD